MSTIEPNSQGWGNEPASLKKNKTWIWVLVAFVVLCLCLGLVAGGVGLYSFLLNNPVEVFPAITTPEEDIPLPPAIATVTAVPEPAVVPVLPLPETLVVEPYLPGETYTWDLGRWVPDYFPVYSAPGVWEWEASISAWETVMMDQYWCAATADNLEQNFEHIEFIWEVDGELIDMESMYLYNETEWACRRYIGIIRAWPPGEHTIIRTMSIDEAINNGEGNDYPAGDYVERFTIIATP